MGLFYTPADAQRDLAQAQRNTELEMRMLDIAESLGHHIKVLQDLVFVIGDRVSQLEKLALLQGEVAKLKKEIQ